MGNNKLDNQNWEEWLHSTGYLYPTNELELARFNKLYAEYNFKLENKSINIDAIIQGRSCSCLKIIESININPDLQELRMVARKGEEIPKHILDKMKNKHHRGKDEQPE